MFSFIMVSFLMQHHRCSIDFSSDFLPVSGSLAGTFFSSKTRLPGQQPQVKTTSELWFDSTCELCVTVCVRFVRMYMSDVSVCLSEPGMCLLLISVRHMLVFSFN